MKFLWKKIVSFCMCLVLVLEFGSANYSYAATETRSVVDLGFCGLYGDNLKWTLYSDGELIINGNGNMAWYYVEHESNGKESLLSAPWAKYYDNIEIVTIEEGVTSIGNDAFVGKNIKYKKINIPLSLKYFEGSMFRLIKKYQPKGKHIAFCYAGSESEWDAVECKHYNIEFDEESQNYRRTLLSTSCANRIEYTGYEDFQKMYFNGDEPTDFCEINRTSSTVSVNSFEKVDLYAHYYFRESEDAKLIWSIEGNGLMIQETINKSKSTLETSVSLYVYGDTTVKLKMVSPSGITLDSDEITFVSSSRKNSSFLGMVKEFFVQNFLLFFIFVVGVLGGTVGPWIGSFF